jgi:hypothetical protein
MGVAMTNIQVAEFGVLPANYAQTQDATLYDNEPAEVVARISNVGGHTGQFKVMVKVDGQNVHDEWIHDLSGGGEKWLVVPLQHLRAGEHHLMVLADTTSRVDETEEYFDNVGEKSFEVHYRQINADPDKIEVHVSEQQWEKAGWKRANVYVQIWDYDNHPLANYDVYLNVEGQSDWHPAAQNPMQDGAAEFHKLLLHPDAPLHIMCQTSHDGLLPRLDGTFDANINAHGNVQIKSWQDAAIDTFQAADQHAVALQLSASLQVSGKVGFKVLGMGAEAGVSATGGVSHTTTDTHTTSRTFRILYPKTGLLPQQPTRAS